MIARTQSSLAQLFRYALVGIATNSICYLIYLLITYLGTAPKVAMTLLYVIGASLGFLGNRTLTFASTGNVFNSGLRYLLAHVFGYFLNLCILTLFVDKFGYAHQLVQAIAIFVVAGFLFVAFKLFVFPDRNAPESGRP